MSQNDPPLLDDGTPMSPEQIRAEFQRMQGEIQEWRLAAEVEAYERRTAQEEVERLRSEMGDWKLAAMTEAAERRRSHKQISKMQTLLKDIAAKRIVEIETLFEQHDLNPENLERLPKLDSLKTRALDMLYAITMSASKAEHGYYFLISPTALANVDAIVLESRKGMDNSALGTILKTRR